MYQNILIATDGSVLSQKAVDGGIALASAIGAKITVLTVSPPFHLLTTDREMIGDTPAAYDVRMHEHVLKILDPVASAAKAAGVTYDAIHAEHQHPYEAIIDIAHSKGCDLIVMASHGRHGVSAIVLGSETVKVLTHSTIPVLVYR